jgi:cytochrome c oxidase subunit 3
LSSPATHPEQRFYFESLKEQKGAATLGMWAFIAQEVMFFGGLFAAYAVYRYQYFDVFAAASHHLDLPLATVNTAVLIASSLTMAMAVHAAALGHRRAISLWLIATVLLGTVFLGIKVVEYKEKYDHHLIPGASFSAHELGLEGEAAQIYYSLYFGMTGLHALHMIIGIPILLMLAWQARGGRFGPEYHTPVEMTGLYWHFVDIVWIFLFPLLYLIH